MSGGDFNNDFSDDFSILGPGASPSNFNGPGPTIQQAYDVAGTVQGVFGFVGTTSQTLIGPDPQRNGITFVNPGTETIWVVPDNLSAIAGQGVPIPPGATVDSFQGDGVRVRWPCGWNAIAASGSANPITLIVR